MSLGGIWSFLLLVLGVYLAIGRLLFLTQLQLLYYPNLPSRAVVATPARIGLAFEDVTLTAEDGVRLAKFGDSIEIRGQRGNSGTVYLLQNAA